MPYDEARLAWTSSVNVSKAERVLIWASAIRAFEGSGTSFTTTTTTTIVLVASALVRRANVVLAAEDVAEAVR